LVSHCNNGVSFNSDKGLQVLNLLTSSPAGFDGLTGQAGAELVDGMTGLAGVEDELDGLTGEAGLEDGQEPPGAL
jgi:hypothetical protein